MVVLTDTEAETPDQCVPSTEEEKPGIPVGTIEEPFRRISIRKDSSNPDPMGTRPPRNKSGYGEVKTNQYPAAAGAKAGLPVYSI